MIYDAAARRVIHWRDGTASAATDSAVLRNGKALLQVESEQYMELDQ